jgi:hypothetical protein
MTGEGRYIAGVPCWVDTSQPDPEAAVAFYGGLFGWECEDRMPESSPERYYIARLGGGDVAAIASKPAGDSGPAATWNTYVSVERADETAGRVREAGGQVVLEPFDVGAAGRMAVLADPAGASFCAWEPREHHGAAVVNAHGSVNFNDLHTRDTDGAKRFYNAVFGWETLDFGGGYASWTLPGYGDFLEARDPGLRARMADMGAPTGFEDVVASLAPLPDAQPDVPPHWGVTFGVDDADAVAARAAELGGTVLTAPHDAPWVRMAVIRDPQGATFVASQFAPENKDVPASGVAAGA